jgi:HlyD family secretion protein
MSKTMTETPNEYDDLLEGSDHPWRKRIIGLVALAGLIAVGAYVLWSIVLGGGGSSAAETQTATVQRGSIALTVSTTGVAVAQSTADLSFEQSGTVSAVNVALGQEVKQGEILAEIEPDELESAVTTAELNLASAQAQLDDLLAEPTASERASADQSLLQAQASLDEAEDALQDVLDGPSDTELRAAEQAVASAQSQLAKAEESREGLYSASDDAVAAAEQALEKAQDALDNAELAADSAGDGVSSAEAALYSAETDYCGSSEEDVSRCATRGAYCYGLDYDVSFCTGRAAPVSSEDQDTLQDVTTGGEPEPAAKAASVFAANASYLNALASKNSADDAVESARADLEAAQADLEEAKEGPSSTDIAAADVEVAAAQLALDEADANLDELKAGPTEEDVADAQNNVDAATAALAVAQAKWDDVYDGADALEIELQRGQVRQAEEAVEEAQQNLEDAQLTAPFDGTVAELNITVGDEVGGGAADAAIVLSTPDAVYLSLTITESDVTSVQVGQSGIATFDALEGQAFPITIESVGTNPTTTQGVVTYQAQASVQTGSFAGAAGAASSGAASESAAPTGTAAADTAAKPLPGMNASVTITVAQAQDVLTVPESAIQTEGPNSVVEVLNDDGTTENVIVQTGLSDGSNIEITQGLEEGQTVVISSRAATASAAATQTAATQQGAMPEGGMPPGGPTEGSAP